MKPDKETNNNFEASIEEGQGFYNAQSSKVSQNIRTLVLGIIPIIWVVSYNNGVFKLPNWFLIFALFASFVYLIMDILHYFIDTCFYYKKLLSLEDHYGEKDYLEVYNNELIKHGKVSYGWIWAKLIAFIFVAISFLIGMICQLL